MGILRRQFLGLGGLAAAGVLTGCASARSGTPRAQSSAGPVTSDRQSGDVVTDAGEATSIPGVAELRGTGSRGADADAGTARVPLAAFAARLFRAVAPGQDNVVISPYSVLSALGMTEYGARGDAAAAMVRGLGAEADEVSGWIRSVDAAVARAVDSGTQNSSRAPVETVVDAANSLFVQSGLPIRREFLDDLTTGYGTGLRTCDFAADAEKCREAMNTWVAQRTHELIPHLLPDESIDDRTRLVLVNALYLSAAWDTEFRRGAAAEFAAPGGSVSVPYLGITDNFGYTTGDGWASVSLPYAGGGLAMTILLPDEGAFGEVARRLDGRQLTAASAGSRQNVAVRMPPFSGTTATSLKAALTGMGMGPMFGGDLSGVTGHVGEVTVGDVIHQAKIDVDEHGTRAAAATAVVAPGGAPQQQDPPEPITFQADRPFLYWIHDTRTGFPLFLGRVTNPAR